MKYLTRIIECGLYFLVFLLPLGTRWLIKPGELNGYWEYGTYSLYATDVWLIFILLLFIIQRFLTQRISNFPPSPRLWRTSEFRISNLIQNSKFKIKNYLIAGIILASAVSVFFAADKPLALYKLGWLVLGVGWFWLVVRADYDRPKAIYALLAGAFLQAGLGIWQFLSQATFASKWLGLARHQGVDLGASVIEAAGAVGSGERWLRAYGGLDHPNVLGGVLAIAILLLIGQIISKERVNNFQLSLFPALARRGGRSNFQTIFNDKIFKLINWLLALILTAGLFFSFSRSAWLALAAGLALMIVLAVAGGNLKSQKGLAEIILVMGILWLVLFSQCENLIAARLSGESRLEIKSAGERLASYQEAWGLIKNNWLFGAGLGNYTLVIHDKVSPNQAGYYYQPAHNAFLLAFSEIGIFGWLFFIGLIIFAFMRLPRPRMLSGARDDSKAAILTALVALMLFDHWLWSLHFGWLFFWLILGLAAGDKNDKELISI